MPADNIERSLKERIPEPLLAWCNGQSIESRFSSSVYGPIGGGGAVARAAGAGALRQQFTKARREDAQPMPRFPVIAATAERIYIFDGPIAQAEAVSVLDRAACEVLTSGKGMWHRLDLVVDGPPPRSYTTFFNVLIGSRRRLKELMQVLDAGSD